MAGVDAPLASLDEEDAYVCALRETGGEDTTGGACGTRMRRGGGRKETRTSADDDKVILVELAGVDVAGDAGIVCDQGHMCGCVSLLEPCKG